MADSLDRGKDQKVKELSSIERDGFIELSVKSDTDTSLEVWAANEAAKTFRDVYAKPISVIRAKTPRQ
jgi:hypothetical protein